MGPRAFCKRRFVEPIANLGPRAACRYIVSRRCGCRRRLDPKKKEKKEDEDVEVGSGDVELELAASPNGQDADECERQVAAPCAAEIPDWQMPKLVVDCGRRRGARIFRGTSVILPDAGGDLIAGVVANLPLILQVRPCWHLGYSMAVDGVSLKTLYRQVTDVGPCILVIEDSSNCIFGAFLADGLKPGSRCYGEPGSFLFRFPRSAGAWRTEVYGIMGSDSLSLGAQSVAVEAATLEEQPLEGAHWANYKEAVRKCQAWATAAPTGGIFCDQQGIVVGIDGPALFIDQNLLRGVSWPSAAFGSPWMAGAAQPDFVVRNFEVWHWPAA